MQKGEATRRHIIQKSAPLFNQQGYAGTSLSDIMSAADITKGGLYRHFSSKDEIAAEAFEYATQTVGQKFESEIAKRTSAVERLLAFFDVYEDVVDDPPFVGGCPLLNTAVECDDTHPDIREKAQLTLKRTLDAMKQIIDDGMQKGEFIAETNSSMLAAFILSLLEGGIMISKLEGNNAHMRNNRQLVAAYLNHHSTRVHGRSLNQSTSTFT